MTDEYKAKRFKYFWKSLQITGPKAAMALHLAYMTVWRWGKRDRKGKVNNPGPEAKKAMVEIWQYDYDKGMRIS